MNERKRGESARKRWVSEPDRALNPQKKMLTRAAILLISRHGRKERRMKDELRKLAARWRENADRDRKGSETAKLETVKALMNLTAAQWDVCAEAVEAIIEDQ